MRAVLLAGLTALALTGCATQRETNGALIGGGAGAVIGGVATHSVGGAVVGGAVGAVAGATVAWQVTAPRRPLPLQLLLRPHHLPLIPSSQLRRRRDRSKERRGGFCACSAGCSTRSGSEKISVP